MGVGRRVGVGRMSPSDLFLAWGGVWGPGRSGRKTTRKRMWSKRGGKGGVGVGLGRLGGSRGCPENGLGLDPGPGQGRGRAQEGKDGRSRPGRPANQDRNLDRPSRVRLGVGKSDVPTGFPSWKTKGWSNRWSRSPSRTLALPPPPPDRSGKRQKRTSLRSSTMPCPCVRLPSSPFHTSLIKLQGKRPRGSWRGGPRSKRSAWG